MDRELEYKLTSPQRTANLLELYD